MTWGVGWVVEEVVAGTVLVPVLALDPVSVPDPVPVVPVVWLSLPEVPEEDEAEALSPSSLW